MTPFARFDDRFERDLHDALDGLASPQYPDYFDDVLAEAVAHRQRPAWTFLERWIPVSTATRRSVLVPQLPWRMIGILMALLALLVAGAIISFGLRTDRIPAPFGPAANGLIAYPADGDIFSYDIVTGEVRPLVTDPAEDVSPFFSRDGRSLAWVQLDPGDADLATLMVAEADGSNARALVGPALIDWAAWSPRSDSLAVIAEGALSIVPTAPGAEATRIEVPVVPESSVEWRPPNGGELIFRGADGANDAIYGVRRDGTGFRQISAYGSSQTFHGPFELTPDGAQLLYTSTELHVHVRVLDLNSGEDRAFGTELPPPPNPGGTEHHGAPSLLPDGETIVFGRYWDESGGTINHQLWTASIGADGADGVAIGPVHRSRSGHNPFWQAVAPDGTSVLVVENDTLESWLAAPHGSTRESLDLGKLTDPPSWQRVAP